MITFTVTVLDYSDGPPVRRGKLGPVDVDNVLGVFEPQDGKGPNKLILKNGTHYLIEDFGIDDLLTLQLENKKQKILIGRN